MNQDQLKYFDALASELHFGAAARRLNVSPSTLSRRVSELERSLGVRLFHPSSRRVALSQAGAALLEAARQPRKSHW
jgi:DNA-binding transcriptional LysR family regulator